MTKITFIRLLETWRADNFSDPPIGLLSVIASARKVKHNGKFIEVNYYDMNINKNIPKSDIYGLSSCSLDFSELLKTAKQIKEQYGGKVVAGGVHFDVFSEEYWKEQLDKLPIDIISRGEGEANIEAIINSDYNKRIITQTGLLNLDDIPMPAWDVLDAKRYFKTRNGVAMSSRGCPSKCGFCASPNIWKNRVRFRDIDLVEKELDYLIKNYGINYIRFQDDSLVLNPKRFKDLSDMIATKNIHYRASLRTDQLNDNILKQFKYGGADELGYGIESSEQNVLDILNKHNTVENNEKALIMSKEYGFKTRAFIMVGLPLENKYSADKMIKFLEKTDPDIVTLTSFMPLPGSDIYNHPEKYGVTILDNDWAKYDIALKLAPNAPFVHRINTATIEEMEVNREMLKEYLFNKGKSNVSQYNKPYKIK